MSDAPETERQRKKPWFRVLLVVSLGLNLLVAGAVIGSFAKGGGKHGAGHSRMEQIGGPLTHSLTKEQRRNLGKEVRQAVRESGIGRTQQTEVLNALLVDLKAERFDREAVAGHMARQRNFMSQRMALGQGLLLEKLEQMSVEDRMAFADRLEHALNKRRNK